MLFLDTMDLFITPFSVIIFWHSYRNKKQINRWRALWFDDKKSSFTIASFIALVHPCIISLIQNEACGVSQITMAERQTPIKYTIKDLWKFPCNKLKDILRNSKKKTTKKKQEDHDALLPCGRVFFMHHDRWNWILKEGHQRNNSAVILKLVQWLLTKRFLKCFI